MVGMTVKPIRKSFLLKHLRDDLNVHHDSSDGDDVNIADLEDVKCVEQDVTVVS